MANTNEDQLSQTGRSYYKIGDNGNWWEGYDGSSWIDTGEVVNVPGPIYIQGIQGPRGPQGTNGDPIPGPKGDPGPEGPQGPEGPRGPQGIQGFAGKDFSVAKTFPSIAEMNASGGAGLTEGDFVMISSEPGDEDNAKLYLWNGTEFTYISDLSGAAGVKGDKGDQGVQGIQGIQGIQGPLGPEGPAGKDGTNADSAYKTITIEGSPLDLSQGVRTFTAFDSTTGENIPDFSVNIISSNWTSRYSIHRLTFLQSSIDKAAGHDTYNAIITESTSAVHDCDVYGVLEMQDTTRAMQLKLVPTDLTVNHQVFGPDGNAQIDATNIGMGGGSTQLVSEAIASKADATNVVTSVNGYKGDAYVVSENIVLNQRTDNTLYFSWLEDGSLKNTEVNNIQIVNALTSAPIQLTPPSVEVSYSVGAIHMYKDKDDSTVTLYSGATMASTVEDYTMRYIDFTVSESGFTNVLLYLEPTNAPIGVLPIANGGTGNADGLARGVIATGKLTGTDDLNDLKTEGKWIVPGVKCLHTPMTGASYAVVTNELSSTLDGYLTQTFNDSSNVSYTRTYSGNPFVWSAWKQVYTGTGNIDGNATSLTMINVPADTDLNTIVTPGFYVNRNNSTSGITNFPPGTTSDFFMMEVYATSIRTVMQRYWDSVGKKLFIRGSSGNPSTFSDWVELGTGDSGAGSIVYGGQFRFGSTNFTGADTVTIRATGAVDNIKGNDSNIVTADPENGVALFTNPTSKPITVILNAGFTLNRTSGTADTLPKKFNIVPVNADIGGGISDESHLSDTGSVQLTAGGLGATNRNVISPSYFTIPANGKFRLSYSIDGYGAMSDTYTTQATMTYVAFREDAKVSTEAINIPWTNLTGANGGTAGQYKKIGSWTVIRWDITVGSTTGNYALGTLPVDAAPTTGIMDAANQQTTDTLMNHLQINGKTGSGAGGVTILGANAGKIYRGQIVFNNDGPETVAVPYLADYDILLPNNKVVVGQIKDGIGTEFAMDPNVGMYAKTREFQAFLLSSGLLINTLDSSGNVLKSYNWNPISGVKLANDVPWTDFPLNTIEWVNQGGDWTCRYKVTNNTLYVEGRVHSVQQVPVSTQNVDMGTVPGVALDRNTTYTCRTTNGLDVHIDVSKTGKFTFQGAWNGGTKSAMGASDLLNMSFTIPLIDL